MISSSLLHNFHRSSHQIREVWTSHPGDRVEPLRSVESDITGFITPVVVAGGDVIKSLRMFVDERVDEAHDRFVGFQTVLVYHADDSWKNKLLS